MPCPGAYQPGWGKRRSTGARGIPCPGRSGGVFDSARNTRDHLWTVAAAALLALAAALMALSAAPKTAEAAKGGTCESFAVTTGGQTFRGDQDRTIRAAAVGEI